MRRKTRVVLLALLLCLGAVIVSAFFSGDREPPLETDGNPLRERGMRAVVIGGELASIARTQLEALPDEHRNEVEELLIELEEKVGTVKKLLLRKDTDPKSLDSAVSVLEALLDGILVVPQDEMSPQERSPNP
jgi:hypothetical protein